MPKDLVYHNRFNGVFYFMNVLYDGLIWLQWCFKGLGGAVEGE